MLIRLLSLMMITVALSACAYDGGQISRTKSFGQNNQKTLVVLGVTLFSNAPYPLFRFRGYDPETGLSTGRNHFIDKSNRDTLTPNHPVADALSQGRLKADGHLYYIFEVEPGSWFLRSAHLQFNYQHEDIAQRTVFSNGAISFDAKPGTITYIGELRLDVKRKDRSDPYSKPLIDIKTTTANLKAAQDYLKGFPNIRSDVRYVEPAVYDIKCADESIERTQCPFNSQQLDLSNNKALFPPMRKNS